MAIWRKVYVAPSGETPGGYDGGYTSLQNALTSERANVAGGSGNLSSQNLGHLIIEMHYGDYGRGTVGLVDVFTSNYDLDANWTQNPQNQLVIKTAPGDEAKGRYRGGQAATTLELTTGDFAAPAVHMNNCRIMVRTDGALVDFILTKMDSGSGSIFCLTMGKGSADDGQAVIRRLTIAVHESGNTAAYPMQCYGGFSTIDRYDNSSALLGDVSHNLLIVGSSQTGSDINSAGINVWSNASGMVHRVFNNTYYSDQTDIPRGIRLPSQQDRHGNFDNNLMFRDRASVNDLIYGILAGGFFTLRKNATLNDESGADVVKAGGQTDFEAGATPATKSVSPANDLEDFVGGDFRLKEGSILASDGTSLADNQMLVTTDWGDVPKTIDLVALPASAQPWPVGAFSVASDVGPVPPTFTGTIANQSDVEDSPITPLDITGEFTDGGGANPIYSMQSGTLPTGITLSSAGVFSGTPTTVGTSTGLVVRLTTDEGFADSNTFQWEITSAATPPVFTGNIENQTNNIGHSVNLDVSTEFDPGTGTSPTYSISAGALPIGLALNPTSGVISGTIEGNFSLTVGNNTGFLYGYRPPTHPVSQFGDMTPATFGGETIYSFQANTSSNIVSFDLGDAGGVQLPGVASLEVIYSDLQATLPWTGSRYEVEDAGMAAAIAADDGLTTDVVIYADSYPGIVVTLTTSAAPAANSNPFSWTVAPQVTHDIQGGDRAFVYTPDGGTVVQIQPSEILGGEVAFVYTPDGGTAVQSKEILGGDRPFIYTPSGGAMEKTAGVAGGSRPFVYAPDGGTIQQAKNVPGGERAYLYVPVGGNVVSAIAGARNVAIAPVNPGGGFDSWYANLSTAWSTELGLNPDLRLTGGHLVFHVFPGNYNQGIGNLVETLTQNLVFNDFTQDQTHQVIIRSAQGNSPRGRYRGGTSSTSVVYTGDYAAPAINTGIYRVEVGRFGGLLGMILEKGQGSSGSVVFLPFEGGDYYSQVRRCTISTYEANLVARGILDFRAGATLNPGDNTVAQLGDVSFNLIICGPNSGAGLETSLADGRIKRQFNNTVIQHNPNEDGVRWYGASSGNLENNLVKFITPPALGQTGDNIDQDFNANLYLRSNAGLDDDAIRDFQAANGNPTITGNLGITDGIQDDLVGVDTGNYRPLAGSLLDTGGENLDYNSMLIPDAGSGNDPTDIEGNALPSFGESWFIGAFAPTELTNVVGGQKSFAYLPDGGDVQVTIENNISGSSAGFVYRPTGGVVVIPKTINGGSQSFIYANIQGGEVSTVKGINGGSVSFTYSPSGGAVWEHKDSEIGIPVMAFNRSGNTP